MPWNFLLFLPSRSDSSELFMTRGQDTVVWFTCVAVVRQGHRPLVINCADTYRGRTGRCWWPSHYCMCVLLLCRAWETHQNLGSSFRGQISDRPESNLSAGETPGQTHSHRSNHVPIRSTCIKATTAPKISCRECA